MTIPRILMLACLLATGFSASAGETVPEDARRTIDAVNAAATSKDFKALEALMVRDFTWSFGGDGDARQAIASWRTDPEAMKALVRATAMRCGRLPETEIIQCPGNADIGHRAGFERTPSGWRMTYFVAGD